MDSNLADNNKVQQQRHKEIDFLQNLRTILLNVKQELNNDLTKMAIKNLPILAQDSRSNNDKNQHHNNDTEDSAHQINLSQSSIDEFEDQQPQQQQDVQIQQLEPLDLDV